MANPKNTVLPPGFVVTRCPPGTANATSLRTLRAQEEKALEMGYSGRVEMVTKKNAASVCDNDSDLRMQESEIYMETVCGARFAGLSSSDALDEGNDAVAGFRRSNRRNRR